MKRKIENVTSALPTSFKMQMKTRVNKKKKKSKVTRVTTKEVIDGLVTKYPCLSDFEFPAVDTSHDDIKDPVERKFQQERQRILSSNLAIRIIDKIFTSGDDLRHFNKLPTFDIRVNIICKEIMKLTKLTKTKTLTANERCAYKKMMTEGNMSMLLSPKQEATTFIAKWMKDNNITFESNVSNVEKVKKLTTVAHQTDPVIHRVLELLQRHHCPTDEQWKKIKSATKEAHASVRIVNFINVSLAKESSEYDIVQRQRREQCHELMRFGTNRFSNALEDFQSSFYIERPDVIELCEGSAGDLMILSNTSVDKMANYDIMTTEEYFSNATTALPIIELKASASSRIIGKQRVFSVGGFFKHIQNSAVIQLYEFDTNNQLVPLLTLIVPSIDKLFSANTKQKGVNLAICFTCKINATTNTITSLAINDTFREQLTTAFGVDGGYLMWEKSAATPNPPSADDIINFLKSKCQKLSSPLSFAETMPTDMQRGGRGQLHERVSAVVLDSQPQQWRRQFTSRNTLTTNDATDMTYVNVNDPSIVRSVQCKTVSKNHNDVNQLQFPLIRSNVNGQRDVPMTIDSCCDVVTAVQVLDEFYEKTGDGGDKARKAWPGSIPVNAAYAVYVFEKATDKLLRERLEKTMTYMLFKNEDLMKSRARFVTSDFKLLP
jgi:hypothetical protein